MDQKIPIRERRGLEPQAEMGIPMLDRGYDSIEDLVNANYQGRRNFDESNGQNGSADYSELQGKKVLYLPEYDLDNSMVGRWRHFWPSKHLGDYGMEWDIKGSTEPFIYRPTADERAENPARAEVEIAGDKGFNEEHTPGMESLCNLKEDVDGADVVVFGRTNNLFGKELFEYAKNSGKVVGYEVDDLTFGPRGIFYENGNHNVSDAIDEQIRDADFVTTTTQSLQKELADLRGSYDNIYIIRNRVDLDALSELVDAPIQHENRPDKKIRVGWAGAGYHLKRIYGVKEAYRDINSQNPGKVTFVFKGIDEDNLKSSQDAETLRSLKQYFDDNSIDYEFHGYTPQKDWTDYYKSLKDLNVDIFHAPGGIDSEYVGKSELKYLEAAIAGAPIVTQDIGGHGEVIEHKVNGMLIPANQQTRGFTDCIDELINDPELRNKIARNARYNLINEYDVRKSSHELAGVFREQLTRNGKLEGRVNSSKIDNSNHLAILMGSPGTGKSTVARKLCDEGYNQFSLDGIIHGMYGGRRNNELSMPEIAEAYSEMSRQVAQALESSNVVVDEWFYIDGTLDRFLTDINQSTPVHYFNLTGDLDTLIERARSDPDPTRPGIIEEHYKMTNEKPTRAYSEFPLHKIDVVSRRPQDISWLIRDYIRRNQNRRSMVA
jgi:glycosyltransferase involved in cell wall biosynthesis